MKIKAVLFDMDGTIIDSEPMHTKTTQDVVRKKIGVNLTEDEIEEYAGLDYEHKLKELFKEREINADHNKLGNLIRNETLKNPHLIKKINGVENIIKTMKDTFKIALVTGSSREQTELFLEELGLKKHFDIRVTATDVKNNKPYPDSYLLAANKLDVKPEECVAIEDSLPGITAAKSAGMYCIGIEHQYNDENDLSKADKVVDDIRKVNLELINSL